MVTTTTKVINCAHCGKFLAWEIEDTDIQGAKFVYRETPGHYERSDKVFCNDVCGAAYHRENEQPDFHAHLERVIDCACEWCGKPYKINEYADRGGKRPPKYCSAKCRLYAWRDRQ